MKKYISIYNNGSSIEESFYFVGHKSDIKAMYKSICRNGNTSVHPLFCEFPRFSEHKEIYVLCIEDNYFMTVINCDRFMELMFKPELHICALQEGNIMAIKVYKVYQTLGLRVKAESEEQAMEFASKKFDEEFDERQSCFVCC